MEKNNPKLELTQDEKGQLNGGYALQSSTTNGMENHFFSDNGNCKGDGWFDDNVNCSRCAGCDKHTGMETFQPVQP
ncbi:hypothetical protein [Bacteroides acidifaciens]|mgnify:FL=1|uniref:hypothetical protein n=1 Tax=Bacteroides acidifaciens TaxID=85831 RepID=UPI0025926B5F|nr:hypothetical protein [Bacteroides acidifaciens]